MDTMTYAAVAAARGDSAERDNELPVYYRTRKLMKVQHFLQTSALIIAKHRCRSYGWCCTTVRRQTITNTRHHGKDNN
jgi:hypothetical protein